MGEKPSSFALTQIVNASGLPYHLLWYLDLKVKLSRISALALNSTPNDDFAFLNHQQEGSGTCTSVSRKQRSPADSLATDGSVRLKAERVLNLSRAPKESKEDEIRRYYRTLYLAWGAQHWWPAETRFEVIVGAYLTQNTAWTNVELALAQLRKAGRLSVEGIRSARLSTLERLIRSSGYFRQKAKRLKTFVAFLDAEYAGSLDRLFAGPTNTIRQKLLDLNGVGPETADSILLYAGNHPVFVVDAYTRRIVERHNILPVDATYDVTYEDVRNFFERALAPIANEEEHRPAGVKPALESGIRGAAHSPSAISTAHRTALVQVYNEMHGLIVGVGKHYCKKSEPDCESCPLRPFCPIEPVEGRRSSSPLWPFTRLYSPPTIAPSPAKENHHGDSGSRRHVSRPIAV